MIRVYPADSRQLYVIYDAADWRMEGYEGERTGALEILSDDDVVMAYWADHAWSRVERLNEADVEIARTAA